VQEGKTGTTAQGCAQQHRLVEASANQTTIVEGNGHHSIEVSQDVVLTCCPPHQLREGPREVHLPSILQAREQAGKNIA
jgi:hypothetical protein